MELDDDQENNFGRSGPPIFGAIFMANRSTKKECLKRKLFGLPPPQAHFVKKVKSGMILFLFEFEERKLYGVYQAFSDAAMNIVPSAFKSSGKQFPAQVRFKTIWDCNPLSECDFRDAIKDNYYAANKFNLGLSKDQVVELLWLFELRKIKVQKSWSPISREKIINWSVSSDFVFEDDEYAPSECGKSRFSMDRRPITKFQKSKSPLSREIIKNRSHSSDFVSVSEHDRYIPSDCGRNGLAMDNEPAHSAIYPGSSKTNLSIVSSDCAKNRHAMNSEPANLARYPGLSSSYPDISSVSDSRIFRPDTYNSSSDGNSPFLRSVVVPFRVETENLNLPHMRSGNLDVAPIFGDFVPLLPENHFENSSFSRLSQQFLSSGYRDENFSSCEVLGGSTFPEPSLVTIPSPRHATFGRQKWRSAYSPGDDPPYVPDYHYPAALQNEGSPFSNNQPSSATTLYKSHLQLGDSRNIDFHGKLEQDKPTDVERDVYGAHLGLRSDIENKRTSVFSRLNVKQEDSVQDAEVYIGDKDKASMSASQLMDELYQSQKHGRKPTKSSQCVIELNYFHDSSQSEKTESECEDEEQQCNVVAEEATVNFKRRSLREMQGEIEGSKEESDVSSGSRKRRKLLRPSFASVGTRDNGIIDVSCPSVDGLSQEIFECKGGINEALVSSNVGESYERETSKNIGTQIAIHPICFENNSGEICEGGNSEALICSNGDEGNKKESSEKSAVQVVLQPVCFEPANGKIESVSNCQDFKVRVETIIQELNGVNDCSLGNRQGATLGVLVCGEDDHGKA